MEEAGVKKGVLDALIKVNLGLRERRLSRVQVSAIHSRGFHVAFNVTACGWPYATPFPRIEAFASPFDSIAFLYA